MIAPSCRNAVKIRLWQKGAIVLVIFSCYSKTTYSEVCPLGIRLIGSGLASEEALLGESASQARQNEKKMLRLVADFCPTHIVLSTPNHRLLSWANRNHIISVVLLREWPEPLDRQQRQSYKRLLKQLNRPDVEWVGEQGISACEAMVSSRVTGDKLIPWTWPKPSLLCQYSPKHLDCDRGSIHLFYAGAIYSCCLKSFATNGS